MKSRLDAKPLFLQVDMLIVYLLFTEQGKTGKTEHMEIKFLLSIFGILVVLNLKNVMSRALGIKSKPTT